MWIVLNSFASCVRVGAQLRCFGARCVAVTEPDAGVVAAALRIRPSPLPVAHLMVHVCVCLHVCCACSYYRHFRLYQFVLAARPSMQLTQCADNVVDQPFTVRKLKEALLEEAETAATARSGAGDTE